MVRMNLNIKLFKTGMQNLYFGFFVKGKRYLYIEDRVISDYSI